MPKTFPIVELRASNAHRWMVCPGQPRAVSGFADAPGSAADKGTVAHGLLEIMLRLDIPGDEVDQFLNKPLIKEIDGRRADHILVDEQMATGVGHAIDYVRGYLETHKGSTYEIECTLDASSLVGYPTGGTSDVIICDLPREIVVLDYKNGVQYVDHEDNEQLHIYGLGAIAKYAIQISPKTKIRMVIIQPNSRNAGGPVREIVYTYNDLMLFAARAAKAAKAAYSKNPERVAGDHCTFCRAAGTCKTYAETAIQNAGLEFSAVLAGDDSDMKDPISMNADEIAKVIASTAMLKRWLDSVEAEAIRQLMRRKKIPGFKLVGSSPHRRWGDEYAVVEAIFEATSEEMAEELAPRAPISPSQMDKRLRRKRGGNEDLLAALEPYITRNPVEPRIAYEDDPRQPYLQGDEFID